MESRKNIGQVCELLESFGVHDDPEWLAILLFVRNLVSHLSVFDKERASEVQQLVLKEMADKELTDKRFKTIIKHLEDFIVHNGTTETLRDSLRKEQVATQALYEEMNAIFDGLHGSRKRQESRLETFKEQTVEAVSGDESKSDIVKRIRSLVNEVVNEVKEEAREWEERAKALERTANYDPLLVSLHNRRSLNTYLSEAVITAQSRKKSLSLLMIDVDHFKLVNDSHGHMVGDDMLRALAKIVDEHTLRYDAYAARYGGEELVMVFPGTGLTEAAQRAETLRKDVEDYEFQTRKDGKLLNKPLHFTVSIGVAELLPGFSMDGLVDAADKALYRAKNSGRNLVARYSDTL